MDSHEKLLRKLTAKIDRIDRAVRRIESAVDYLFEIQTSNPENKPNPPP